MFEPWIAVPGDAVVEHPSVIQIRAERSAASGPSRTLFIDPDPPPGSGAVLTTWSQADLSGRAATRVLAAPTQLPGTTGVAPAPAWRLDGAILVSEGGFQTLAVSGPGRAQLWVDGTLVLDEQGSDPRDLDAPWRRGRSIVRAAGATMAVRVHVVADASPGSAASRDALRSVPTRFGLAVGLGDAQEISNAHWRPCPVLIAAETSALGLIATLHPVSPHVGASATIAGLSAAVGSGLILDAPALAERTLRLTGVLADRFAGPATVAVEGPGEVRVLLDGQLAYQNFADAEPVLRPVPPRGDRPISVQIDARSGPFAVHLAHRGRPLAPLTAIDLCPDAIAIVPAPPRFALRPGPGTAAEVTAVADFPGARCLGAGRDRCRRAQRQRRELC